MSLKAISTNFYIQTNADLYINQQILTRIYAPLVGKKAISLYNDFVCEKESQKILANFSNNNLEDFLNKYHYTYKEFVELRSKLEAVNLLQTFLSDKDNIKTYYFNLKNPLGFQQFISNNKFKQALIAAIGIVNYQEIEHIYKERKFYENAVDVSSNFESVFELSKDLDEINFSHVYESIFAKINKNFLITPEVKSIINNYIKNFNVSIDETKKMILYSLIEKDNQTTTDADLIHVYFKNYLLKANESQVNKNIILSRTQKLFYTKIDDKLKQAIFNEYESLNEQQYLKAIVKNDLTKEELNTLDKLKNELCLNNGMINLLVDFTFYKAKGRFNKKYLLKAAQTVNNLNINNIDDILSYLKYEFDGFKKINKPSIIQDKNEEKLKEENVLLVDENHEQNDHKYKKQIASLKDLTCF